MHPAGMKQLLFMSVNPIFVFLEAVFTLHSAGSLTAKQSFGLILWSGVLWLETAVCYGWK